MSSRHPSVLPGACLSLVLASCAPTQQAQAPEPPASVESQSKLPDLVGFTGSIRENTHARRVGDVWTHRFSGAYRGAPLILREEVLAQRGNVFVVDYKLEGDKGTDHVRVHMTARSERIVAVYRMEGGKEVLGSIADYEAMIDKTTFVPDTNEGKVAEKSETCLVGMNELSCDVASFEVNVANKAATLSVAHNEELRRDISGEIVAVDGTLLYRAELIEMQRGPVAPSSEAGSVARNDWDPFLD